MAAFSDYLEAAMLDATLRNTSYTSPTTCYLALYTSNPGDDNSGTECSGTNYARQSAAFSRTNATASNTSNITFPTAGSGGWGTLTHFGVLDAVSSGNLLYHGALTASKAITEGDVFRVEAGQLDITLA